MSKHKNVSTHQHGKCQGKFHSCRTTPLLAASFGCFCSVHDRFLFVKFSVHRQLSSHLFVGHKLPNEESVFTYRRVDDDGDRVERF